jgi:uncharacterized protein
MSDNNSFGVMRLMNSMLTRFGFASILFGGKRDMYKALGYPRTITIQMYRDRYEREEVAGRVVEALPLETWAGGGTLVEDEDPNVETDFERAWEELNQRLNIWTNCMRADILSGIGRHGVILLGGPGNLDEELTSCTPEEMMYLAPYGEDDCKVSTLDVDEKSPRYGLPLFYNLTRVFQSATGVPNPSVAKRVHYSRLIHIADNVLDDKVYGEPRLRRIWNRLDDLMKVAGGGAEAYWKRADGGRQFDLDPAADLTQAELDAMKQEIDAYVHDQKRELTTRGLSIKNLGSDVAMFGQNVDSIISLISAGTGIPQRILLGSERGHLASTQDRSNWEARVESRRTRFAEPYILRPLVDKFISLGVLPEPEEPYRVEWENLTAQTDEERAALGDKWAAINQKNSRPVITDDEIRTKALGLPPLEEVITPEQTPLTLRTAEQVLEAALEQGNLEMIEQLTGLKLAAPVVESTPVLTPEHETNERLLAALAALAARPVPSPPAITVHVPSQPAPVVHVNVEQPPLPVSAKTKRIERDEQGRIASIVEN